VNFDLLVAAILQNRKIQDIIIAFNFSGKNFVKSALKENIAKLIIEFARQESKTNLLNNPINKL
jgi:hypothetical protein